MADHERITQLCEELKDLPNWVLQVKRSLSVQVLPDDTLEHYVAASQFVEHISRVGNEIAMSYRNLPLRHREDTAEDTEALLQQLCDAAAAEQEIVFPKLAEHTRNLEAARDLLELV